MVNNITSTNATLSSQCPSYLKATEKTVVLYSVTLSSKEHREGQDLFEKSLSAASLAPPNVVSLNQREKKTLDAILNCF